MNEKNRPAMIVLYEAMKANERAIKTQVPCGLSFNQLIKELNK